MNFYKQATGVVAALALTISTASAQGFQITRANLAKVASFTVTQTLSPKGGSKVSSTYKVEVSGNRARLDYADQNVGSVRYVANDKGVFLYIPASKMAVKQSFKGGVEGALKVAFAQVNEQLKTAKKTGTAKISGILTDVYKDAKSGATLYIGKQPGFRLPVKTVLSNEGGTRTLLVSSIKLNGRLPNARFAIPAGTTIDEGGTAGMGGGGVPGFGR